MSIRARLTLWHFLVFAAGLIAFELVVWVGTRSALQNDLDTWLTHQGDGLERFLQQETIGSGNAAVTEETREFSTGLPEGGGVQLFDSAGKLLLSRPAMELRNLPDSPAPFNDDHASLRIISRRVVVEGHPFRYVLWRSSENMDRALHDLQLVLMALTPVFLALSAAGGWFLSRRALRPVDNITAAARHISLQNLSATLPVPAYRDELGRLCEAWNEMLRRLDAASKRQAQFTADASHELRTPVAIIRASAEIALLRPRPDDEYRHVLRKILQDCEALTSVIEHLMELTRADAGASGLAFVPVDLRELTLDAGSQMEQLAAQNRISLTVSAADSGIWVAGDAAALRRLLLLLLDNAIKFTPAGGRVALRAYVEKDHAVLEVEDSGVGIPQEALPRIFDRFYQADPSRSGRGVGLGLSIAQWIVHSHNGQIEAFSQIGEGSLFRIVIPRTAGGIGDREQLSAGKSRDVHRIPRDKSSAMRTNSPGNSVNVPRFPRA